MYDDFSEGELTYATAQVHRFFFRGASLEEPFTSPKKTILTKLKVLLEKKKHGLRLQNVQIEERHRHSDGDGLSRPVV